jgi:hypothetical protein
MPEWLGAACSGELVVARVAPRHLTVVLHRSKLTRLLYETKAPASEDVEASNGNRFDAHLASQAAGLLAMSLGERSVCVDDSQTFFVTLVMKALGLCPMSPSGQKQTSREWPLTARADIQQTAHVG